MDGDASAMGRLPPDAVIVLDINKLATEKGDGVTVPTSAFADGRNLVFVDEGHKGPEIRGQHVEGLAGRSGWH